MKIDEMDTKDFGEIKRCLRIDLSISDGGIFINQKIYIKDVLKRFGTEHCSSVCTPLEVENKLVKGEATSDDRHISLPLVDWLPLIFVSCYACRHRIRTKFCRQFQ